MVSGEVSEPAGEPEGERRAQEPPARAARRRWPAEATCLATGAGLLAVGHVAVSLAGGREATTAITGQQAAAGDVLLGLAYVGTNLLAVVGAPVLGLAAVLRASVLRDRHEP